MNSSTPLARHAHLLAIGILVLGLAFFLYRIDQWYMHDDEGGYAYAAWRMAEGEMPYRDFLTPQLPAFLYWGSVLVRLFGRSMLALRMATALAMVLAACLVYLAAGEAFGWRVALGSLPLFLIHKDVYFNARFFRPEAYMLLFVAAAAYAFLVSYRRGKRWGVWLAGALFGLAMLFKLFAALPAAGCGLFLLYQWLRTRDRTRLIDAAVLTAGFAATAGVVFAAFQMLEPHFLTAVLGHHAMQGAQLSAVQVALKALRFYWGYLRGNPVFMLLALWGVIRSLRGEPGVRRYFAWQIPTAAAFLLLSRTLQDRHLAYWVPALAPLAALALEPLLRLQPLAIQLPGSRSQSALSPRVALAMGVASGSLALWPSWHRDLAIAAWDEDDTGRLARYVQSLTTEDDVVLADYPGINFAAGRENTYLGAGLSGGATSSGQITGAGLIREIEAEDVPMVLINTAGSAHQLVNLRDYEVFRRYVQTHFHLIRMFQRSYQTFEIYHIEEQLPTLPDAVFEGMLALTGADLGVIPVTTGETAAATLRWQAVGSMERDYSVSLRVIDSLGHRYGQMDAPLLYRHTTGWEGPREVIEQAPTSRWPVGEVVMHDLALTVPHGTPPGEYRLTALVYDLASGQVLGCLPSDDPSAIECAVGALDVARPPVPPSMDVLPIHTTLGLDVGEGLRLLGTGPIAERARPGDALTLALFWQLPRPTDRDAQLLLRVMGADGALVAEGRYDLARPEHPTSEWSEGEIVLGYYDLAVEEKAPPGIAQMTLQLLDAQGNALGDSILLETIELRD